MIWWPLFTVYGAMMLFTALVGRSNTKRNMDTNEKRKWLTDELLKRHREMDLYNQLCDDAIEIGELNIADEWENRLEKSSKEAEIIVQQLMDL